MHDVIRLFFFRLFFSEINYILINTVKFNSKKISIQKQSYTIYTYFPSPNYSPIRLKETRLIIWFYRLKTTYNILFKDAKTMPKGLLLIYSNIYDLTLNDWFFFKVNLSQKLLVSLLRKLYFLPYLEQNCRRFYHNDLMLN